MESASRIGIVNCREIAFTPSFAVATNVKIPEFVGVPVMAPLGDRMSPGGIEGADHKTVRRHRRRQRATIRRSDNGRGQDVSILDEDSRNIERVGPRNNDARRVADGHMNE